MDGRARLVMAWCRQANECGALTGDLCYVQTLALDLLYVGTRCKEAEDFGGAAEILHNIFMDWLFVEHNEVYEAVRKQQFEKEEEDSYIDISTLDAEDMEELIGKMKRLADMEGDA